MPNIFISYRREETAYVAATIAEKLVNRLGKNSVFLDIDNIPMGVDFRKHIGNAISPGRFSFGTDRAGLVVLYKPRRNTSTRQFGRFCAHRNRSGIKTRNPDRAHIAGKRPHASSGRPTGINECFCFSQRHRVTAGKDFLTQLQRLVEACERFGLKKGTIKPQPVSATIVPAPVLEPQLIQPQAIQPQPIQPQAPQPAQLQPLFKPKPLAQPDLPPRRSFWRVIYKSIRFVIWMDRPTTLFAKVIRAAFLATAVFVAFLSALFGIAVYMAGTVKAEEQLDPTTNILYSLIAAAYPCYRSIYFSGYLAG